MFAFRLCAAGHPPGWVWRLSPRRLWHYTHLQRQWEAERDRSDLVRQAAVRAIEWDKGERFERLIADLEAEAGYETVQESRPDRPAPGGALPPEIQAALDAAYAKSAGG